MAEAQEDEANRRSLVGALKWMVDTGPTPVEARQVEICPQLQQLVVTIKELLKKEDEGKEDEEKEDEEVDSFRDDDLLSATGFLTKTREKKKTAAEVMIIELTLKS